MQLRQRCSQLELDVRAAEDKFQQATSEMKSRTFDHEASVATLKKDLESAQDLSQTLQQVPPGK